MKLYNYDVVTQHLVLLLASLLALSTPFTNSRPNLVTRSLSMPSTDPFVTFVLGDETPASFFIGNIPKQLSHFDSFLANKEKFRATLLDSRGLASNILHLSDMGDLYTISHVDRDDVARICGPLDCCTASHCNLTFDAVFIRPDIGKDSDTMKVKVMVHILDVNDNAPSFQNTRFTLTIPEASSLVKSPELSSVWEQETMHSLPQAKDKDSLANGVVRYQLYGEAVEAGFFALSSSDQSCYPCLLLSNIVRLDYENPKHHNLTVGLMAIDGGEKPLSGSITIHIRLTDMNDNAPIFEKPRDTIRVQENKTYYQPVFIFRASDADSDKNGRLRYTIISPPQHSIGSAGKKFVLDSETGELFIHPSLDYEDFSERKVELVVIASDEGRPSLSTSCTLTVLLEDVNDNLPELIIQQNNSVPENGRGSVLALQMSINDVDDISQGNISCSIADANGLPLRLLSVAGEAFLSIWTTKVLDYEMTPFLQFDLVCIDAAEPPAKVIFPLTIKVTDVNDNPPVFYSSRRNPTSTYDLVVPEDEPLRRPILLPLVIDVDSKDIVFSMEPVTVEYKPSKQNFSTILQHFVVRPESGAISLRAPLDYESIKYYEFLLVAKDVPRDHSNDQVFSSHVLVRVTVKDVNDNPPRLASPSLITIKKGTPAGFLVSRIVFTDPDEDGQQAVSTKLLSQSAFPHPDRSNETESDFATDAFFSLKDNGALVTLQPIARDNISLFHLLISAVDHGELRQMSSTAGITVIVDKSHENVPLLVKPFPGSVVNLQLNIPYGSRQNVEALADVAIQLETYDLGRKSTSLERETIVLQAQNECNGSSLFELDQKSKKLKLSKTQDFVSSPSSVSSLSMQSSKVSCRVCLRITNSLDPKRYSNAYFFVVIERIFQMPGQALWPADAADTSTGMDAHPGGFVGTFSELVSNVSAGPGLGTLDRVPDEMQALGRVGGFNFGLSNIVMCLLILAFSLAVGFALFAAILWARAKQATNSAARQIRPDQSAIADTAPSTGGHGCVSLLRSDAQNRLVWHSRQAARRVSQPATAAASDSISLATVRTTYTAGDQVSTFMDPPQVSEDNRGPNDRLGDLSKLQSPEVHYALLTSAESPALEWQINEGFLGPPGSAQGCEVHQTGEAPPTAAANQLPKLEGPVVAYFDLLVSTPSTQATGSLDGQFEPANTLPLPPATSTWSSSTRQTLLCTNDSTEKTRNEAANPTVGCFLVL
ncbi:hypothetical protein SprV_0401487800 [Sparganum proliferum]